jgi:hypothetical protein
MTPSVIIPEVMNVNESNEKDFNRIYEESSEEEIYI